MNETATDLESSNKSGVAGFSGKLPGIWGTSVFNKPIFGGKTAQQATGMSGVDEFGNPMSMVGTPEVKSGIGNMSWGQMGYGLTALSGTMLTANSATQQMSGGGARNTTQGIGQLGAAVSTGAFGALSAGFGGGFAAAGAAGSASTLATLGVAGMVIMGIMMIASMFMKPPKQSTTQTSETKVGSKIDISNKKLELINRNLIALRNTMETYALATSSYFAEKSYANIDSEFALSTRRSY
jgi:hypothetical protein